MNYFDPHEQYEHSRYNRVFSRYFWRLMFLWNKYVLKKRICCIGAWVSMSWGRVEHNNLGDDLNMFLLRRISKDFLMPRYVYACPKKVFFKGLSSLPVVYAIGSVLHLIDRPDSIIWGAGLLKEAFLPSPKTLNIRAVRGPLTRKVLVANGYDCPAVYGDPALLLPLYYRPVVKKKYKIGIVPHYVDEDKKELDKFKSDDSVLIIHMTGYDKWENVVKQMLSCEFVVSSSLHGIIISEAYGVPNLWAEVREPIIGDVSRRFKFHDFFMSIGLDRSAPYIITEKTSVEDLLRQKDGYAKAPGLDLKPLIESCPFRLKDITYNE